MERVIITQQNILNYASELNNPEVLEQVLERADDLIRGEEMGAAFRFARSLEEALRAARLSTENKKIYNEVLALLKFTGFHALEQPEQRLLLKHWLIYALTQEINVKKFINFSFFPFYFGKEDLPKVTMYLNAIDENEERLGKNPILLGKEAVEPKVKNWILDIKSFARDKKAGGYGVANYLVNSLNAKILNEDDLETLKKLVLFYEWLRFDAIPKELVDLDIAELAATEPEGERSSPIETIRPEPFKKPVSKLPKGFVSRFETPKTERIPKAPSPREAEEDTPKDILSRVEKTLTEKPAAPKKGPLSVSQAEQSELGKIADRTTAKYRYTHPSSRVEVGQRGMSISQAIVNAGTDGTVQEGNIRVGKQIPQQSQAAEKPAPSAPAEKPAPKSPLQVSEKPKAPATPPAKKPSTFSAPRAGAVVDLTKKVPMDLKRISSREELKRLGVNDLRSAGFADSLKILKEKFEELASKEGVTVKDAANMFYRSPVYNLYISMGVAVMNDTTSDQQTAFNKVVKNYQLAGKDYLTRDEFLALNRFKKELAS